MVPVKYITEHFLFTKENINDDLMKECLNNQMFTPGGLNQKVFSYPFQEYNYNKLHLSILRIKDEMASVLWCANTTFGWKFDYYPKLNDCYGMMSFYTKPEYRQRGLASILFEEWDSQNHLRKLCYTRKARFIMRKLSDEEGVWLQ